jgi:hypothetical protein
MKNTLIICLIISILACQNKDSNSKDVEVNLKDIQLPQESKTNATSNDNILSKAKKEMVGDVPIFFSSAAARHQSFDSSKQFVKTAILKFRVKNVMQSSLRIEDIVLKNKGYVTFSEVKTESEHRTSYKISNDSLLETISYVLGNKMELRVPNYLLDTTLREISRYSEYMDIRKITAEDVGFDLFANHLAETRNRKSEARLRNTSNKRSQELVEIEQTALNSEEAADNAKIELMKIKDRIKYSTIQVEIYQSPTFSQHKIANVDAAQHVSFWIKIKDALGDSWTFFKYFILTIIQVLPFILLIIGGVWLKRRYWRKRT